MAAKPLIAFLTRRLDEFAYRVIRRLNGIAQDKGWLVNVLGDEPEVAWQVASEWRCDVAVFWFGGSHRPLLQGLGPERCVAIEADLADQGISSVLIDDEAVGAAAAEHLLAQGLTHFAAFFEPAWFSIPRSEGFRQRVLAAGRTYYDGNSYGAHPGNLRGLKLRERWKLALQALPKPLGAFCPCDAWSTGLANLCLQSGLRIPDDTAIVGAGDDTLFCELARPRLSSVAIPWEQLADRTAELAEHALAGKRGPQRVLVPPAAVTPRSSSDLRLGTSPEIREALSFIAKHACDPIGVDDILRHVIARRRSLERAFRTHVHHSIAEEIRRVRVEKAKHLLIATDLPVETVAQRTGYSTAHGLRAAFSREVGITPGDYRGRSHTGRS